MIAAPAPMSRRNFCLPHLAHLRFTGSLIPWNNSNLSPQASQT